MLKSCIAPMIRSTRSLPYYDVRNHRPVRDGALRINHREVMDKEMRTKISKEVLTNMSITKEQYQELCALCDEMDLSLSEPSPEEPSWDDILGE